MSHLFALLLSLALLIAPASTPPPPAAPQVWTRYAGNPVVDTGLSGDWDARRVNEPAVLREAGGYRMWYTGWPHTGRPAIGLALSDDGITWRAAGTEPVLKPGGEGAWDASGIQQPAVVKVTGGYMLFYSSFDGTHWRLGLATSGDGVRWDKWPWPLMQLGQTGEFDSDGQFAPAVHYDGKVFRLWYTGIDFRGEHSIGTATSRDGTVWMNDPANPVLDREDGVVWGDGVNQPAVIRRDGGWEMWYLAGDGIRRAVSADGSQWTPDPAAPVLTTGATRQWDHEPLSRASVIFDGSTYHIWYGGGSRIGYASSPDGIRWTKRPSAVLEQRPEQSYWEEWAVGRACILPDGDGYRMWYSGHYGRWLILEASSQDGINWQRDEDNFALLPEGSGWESLEVFSPRVLADGDTLHMWYTGWDGGSSFRIGYATSTDNGATWQKSAGNPVLDVGPEGAWDSVSVQTGSVMRWGDGYRMWYIGQDGKQWQAGLATSPDGEHWTRYEHNPVLSPGLTDEWDSAHVLWLHVLPTARGYEAWYTGTANTTARSRVSIGYATSSDGVNWLKDPANPIRIPTQGSWWSMPGQASADMMEPYVLREGDLYRMWYTERRGDDARRLNYAWLRARQEPTVPPQLYLPLVERP